MLEMIFAAHISSLPPSPKGQQLFQTVGDTSFTVPENVTSICACAIAPGLNTGAGGGLSYRNNIQVTPGEVLTITIPGSATTSLPCGIKRGSDFLVVSYTGNTNTYVGGLGGKNASEINDGGGNGGNATYVSQGGTPGPCGGGAGGYAGNGGNAIGGNAPAGGGGGGGHYLYQSPNRNWGYGGGTGIVVQGPSGTGGTNLNSSTVNGKPGSGGSGQKFGGGRNGSSGGVRIIWGNGRSYPTSSADV